jgi:hypothetical protein
LKPAAKFTPSLRDEETPPSRKDLGGDKLLKSARIIKATLRTLRLCEKPGELTQVSRKGAKAQSSQRNLFIWN